MRIARLVDVAEREQPVERVVAMKPSRLAAV